MKIVIEKKYLVVPTNKYAVMKSLRFYRQTEGDRELVMDFECKLDLLNPTYNAYIDVARYKGLELEYCCVPEMQFALQQTDKRQIDGLYREELRPFSHFTPQIGWHNDPNGLIKYHGVYHMFYQHNPLGTERGHMHWGHAISTDLLHWEEQDIALFPDEMGTMYSGSAIEDKNNLTGLQADGMPPMLLFYTAAADCNLLSKAKKRTQCLAYSTDGGKTFEKYQGNPIVNWIESGNRDPKVVWVEELSKYVMVIYLVGSRYELLTSENLLDWTVLQEIEIEGESECPDIMRFEVSGKTHWVIMGGRDRYLIGSFQSGKFESEGTVGLLNFSQSAVCYAAQSFSGIDDGRVVRIAWHRLNMPSHRVPHQMGIPNEMRLIETDAGLMIISNPIEELRELYVAGEEYENVSLATTFVQPLCRAAYDIHLVADYKCNMTVEYFGHTLKLNVKENYLQFGRLKMPISLKQDTVDLRLIIDRCSIEIFADGGKYCAMFPTICDYNIMNLKIAAEEDITLREFSCHRLSSIHPPLDIC